MTKVLFVVCILFLFSSCGKTDNQPQSETATNGGFELVADEVLKPVIDSLVQGFMIEALTAKVTVKYVSAGEAVRELMNHQTRAIIIDRYLTPQEQAVLAKDSVTLPEFRMAEDGIGCVVSSSSQLTVMSLSELREQFNSADHKPTYGQYNRSLKEQNWIENKLPVIDLLLPEYPSSIEYLLDSVLLHSNKTNAISPRRFMTADSTIVSIRKNPYAMGFVSSAWKHELENKNDTFVKFLPIIPHDLSSEGISEPVLLHIAYIAEKAYPLRTMVMGYTLEPANTVPRGFFAYCMTSHGQNTFKNFGILPKTQKIKLVPSASQ